MNILLVLLVGFIVGAVARLVMPGKDPDGILITISIGIAGSLIAQLIGGAAGSYSPTEGTGLLASILGAVVLLAGYRLVVGRPCRDKHGG